MRQVASKLLTYTATLGPVGFIPLAPGTFGTAVCALLLIALRPSLPVLLSMTLAFTIIGTVTAHFAEIYLNRKDPGEVVIDEFAGFMVAMLFVDMTFLSIIIAFMFFRAFDIVKPPPIKYLESRLKGGIGVVMDDLMAGVYANVSVQLCNTLLKMF